VYHDIKPFTFQRRCGTKLYALSLSTAYVNQSLKNRIRSKSYICASLADLLRSRCLRAKSLLDFDPPCCVIVH